MYSVNEISVTIRLADLMRGEDGWGHEEGRRVHQLLLKKLGSWPSKQVVRISLEGVRRTDASFPRESVIELARRFRGQRGFCLVDAIDPDLLENWDAAAVKREQPIFSWVDDQWRLLGPEPSRSAKPVLHHVMKTIGTTASGASRTLGLSLTNVSTKLKQLLESGFVLRREETAPSGGIEYVYFRIR